MSNILLLSNVHKGQTAHVIGRGPSLQYLRDYHFINSNGPIIAVNYAILHIRKLNLSNTIYTLQKDDGQVRPIRSENLIVHELEPSIDAWTDYQPRYTFNNEKDFGISWNEFSTLTCIELARVMGCDKIRYISCDADVNGDTRTYMPSDFSGFVYNEDNGRDYLQHRLRIEVHLNKTGMKAEWFTPTKD